jgi:hypothetical protein
MGIAVLAAAIFAARKWFFTNRSGSAQSPFSLQHLRELRANGQITEQEFDQLKQQIITTMTHSPPTKLGASGNAPRSFDASAAGIKGRADGRR